MVQMDGEGFGNCNWHGECEAACPKAISIDSIARMNRDWLSACVAPKKKSRSEGSGT